MENEIFRLSVHPLDREELREWGVFISHSGDMDTVQEICDALENAHIGSLWDKQIALGADDFSQEIYRMIQRCNCAVVVISENALASQWVNFEVGRLDGLGKAIFLYDPRNLLAKKSERYHYDALCPAYTNVETLVADLEKVGLFHDLFNNETAQLTEELFQQIIDKCLLPVQLQLTLPGLHTIPLESCHFQSLIINFGNFAAQLEPDTGKCRHGRMELENGCCPSGGLECCAVHNADRSKTPECLLLNHVWEKNTVNGEEDSIRFVLPLHRSAGTTFKLFAEVDTGSAADALMALLEAQELSPSMSSSGTQNRIYFSLPQRPRLGVFKLRDGFDNNFICPGVIENY